MNIIKRIRCFVPPVPVPMLIIIGVFAIGPLLIVTTNIYGTTQVVTVSYHKKVSNPRQSSYVVSCGYYYVKGKKYPVQTDGELPIGTKFEIKINPIIPSEHNTMRIIQE